MAIRSIAMKTIARNRLEKSLLACALVGACVPAWAATATGTFTVSGTVITTCSFTTTNLTFGTGIPANILANIDAQNTITATCANGTPYTVDLGVGNGSGATFAARKLTAGVNVLTYSLYTNSLRDSVWGDGVTGGSNHISNTGSGGAQVITVFGRIPPQTATGVGAYTDTIAVTLNF